MHVNEPARAVSLAIALAGWHVKRRLVGESCPRCADCDGLVFLVREQSDESESVDVSIGGLVFYP